MKYLKEVLGRPTQFPEQAQAANTVNFESGAVRSNEAETVRFNLICPKALERLAVTCAEGESRYGPDNWTRGMPINDVLNHAIEHLNQFRRGRDNEDHLAHAAWGIFAVIHFSSECNCHTVRARMAVQDKQYLEQQQGASKG